MEDSCWLENLGTISRKAGIPKEVQQIATESDCEEILARIQNEIAQSLPVIGLDTEWVSKRSCATAEIGEVEIVSEASIFQKFDFTCESEAATESKISLVQIGLLSGLVVLIRIFLMERVPKALKDLLENPAVLKVGVEINEDARRLRKDYGIFLCGGLDIRFLHREIALSRGENPQSSKPGLKELSETLLGLENAKNPKVARSNWAAHKLSEDQVNYAAADAQLSLDCFLKLAWDLKDIPGEFDADFLMKLTEPYLGRKFKSRSTAGQNSLKEKQKVPQRSKTYNSAVISGPLYHNCELQAPDGEPLAKIDRRKVEWYLYKDLVDVVQYEPSSQNSNEQIPKVIRLRKEPKSRPVGTELFYIVAKENLCVVCGRTDSLLRKNVVPRHYRKLFPENMKSHRSHDVLLLCLVCHERANNFEMSMREKLERDCNAPVKSGAIVNNRAAVKAQKLARALLNHEKEIPEEKKSEIRAFLCDFLKVETWTDEIVMEVLDMDCKEETLRNEDHAEKVIKVVRETLGGLPAFERMWREYFVEKMAPKFLPEMWSVDHNKERYDLANAPVNEKT